MAAGAAEGINIWDIYAEERESIPSHTFLPTSTENGKVFENFLKFCYFQQIPISFRILS